MQARRIRRLIAVAAVIGAGASLGVAPAAHAAPLAWVFARVHTHAISDICTGGLADPTRPPRNTLGILPDSSGGIALVPQTAIIDPANDLLDSLGC